MVRPAFQLLLALGWASLGASCGLTTQGSADLHAEPGDDAGAGAKGGSGGSGGSAMVASSSASQSSTSSASSGGGGTGGAPKCGDGIIQPGEQCDDENDVPGDGCNACLVECSLPNERLIAETNHCYRYVTDDDESWSEAVQDCKAIGGGYVLAVLATKEEIATIDAIPNFVENDTWIGGDDTLVEGTFAWVNGEQWTYVDHTPPWSSGQEPNDAGGGEDCVMVFQDGKFNDNDCNDSLPYLCERPPAGMIP